METIRIYSDESGCAGVRHFLLGGLWIPEAEMGPLESEILKIRDKYGYKDSNGTWVKFLGELKWHKVSKRYLPVYKEYIDLLFSFLDSHRTRFCCLLLDMGTQEVKSQKNILGFQVGYFKLYYQLYFQNCEDEYIYKIFPDTIPTSDCHPLDLFNLQNARENSLAKKFGPNREQIVNNITPVNSKYCEPIQIVDIVIGAIGYGQNDGAKQPGKINPAKRELAEYLNKKLVTIGALKPIEGGYERVRSQKFNLWLFQPNKKDTS